MKYRISDTDIIDIDKVDYIEIDSNSISFNINGSIHQSFYKTDQEAQYVFNNFINTFKVIDLRFEVKKNMKEVDKKEKAFDMFWNLYDKKVDKPNTRKSFMNLTIKDMGRALNKVMTYVDSTPDKQYRKNPRTWINTRGWEDELKSSKRVNRYVKPKYVDDER
tara:strand:+ start:3228 stop:3716 length:489 start_codon:yes stop_codon:yes gene_type:complete